jgi:hypothetical protein
LDSLVVNANDATASSEAVVPASVVNSPNSDLPECRGTHDAGLDGHVKSDGIQGCRIHLEDVVNSLEFGMEGGLGSAVGKR